MIIKRFNKYERIKLVRDFDLNTEDNMLITPLSPVEHYFSFLNKLKHCSIRTFHGEDVNTPHYPLVTVNKAKKLIQMCLECDYNIILATPIDPKHTLFCGTLWIKPDQYIVELADGPGTVRRVTHDSIVDRRYILNKNQLTNDNNLNISISKMKSIGLENVIFEFSWYKKKVGYKKQNFICWEVTDDGTGNSGL